MKVERLDKKTVSLHPKNLTMDQPLGMNLFVITGYALIYTNTTNDDERVSMKIVLKRKIMSEMMTTYFPSALLMLITFATTFFKPFFFEAALSVNLTTMLVMTTIFISKMEGLPPTSATKMIDYWLILCQLVPFAQVVLLTAMEYLREEELDKEEDKEDSKVSTCEEELGPDPETKDAWKDSKETRYEVDYVSMLTVVGKSHFSEVLMRYNDCLSLREKSSPISGSCCLHHLLWHRCQLLL